MLGDSMRRKSSCRKIVKFSSSRSQMEQSKLSGRDQVFQKIHLNTGSPCTRRRAQRWSSRRIGRVSTIRDNDGWQWSPKRFLVDRRETFIVITWNQELNSVTKEESFPTPLRYNDVVRERLTKKSSNFKTCFFLWLEIWSGMTKTAHRREKPANGPPRNGSSTMLEWWGAPILSIPKVEFKETKNAWKKLEWPVESVMLCKVQNHQRREPCGKGSDTRIAKYACIIESQESTRKRLERTPKDHEDRIAGKGFNELNPFLVHKFISMKIPDAKAALDNEWGKTSINCQHGKWPVWKEQS